MTSHDISFYYCLNIRKDTSFKFSAFLISVKSERYYFYFFMRVRNGFEILLDEVFFSSLLQAYIFLCLKMFLKRGLLFFILMEF